MILSCEGYSPGRYLFAALFAVAGLKIMFFANPMLTAADLQKKEKKKTGPPSSGKKKA